MSIPTVWQMIKEAVNYFDGQVSYKQIKEFINANWENVNQKTINAQIISLTVNHFSRIHYPGNEKPRLTDANSPYDFLFQLKRGVVEKYNIQKHGIWEIFLNEETLAIRKHTNSSHQNSFLFVWNPSQWPWEELKQDAETIKRNGKVSIVWTCQSHKKAQIGDRAFIIRVGEDPKGIVASGFITSKPFLSKHWRDNKNVYRVSIDLEILINPNNGEEVLPREALEQGNLGLQHWSSQSSGILIKEDIAMELEAMWLGFLSRKSLVYSSTDLYEGTPYQVAQTLYERSPYARKQCLDYYGYSCKVCDVNFESRYGLIGKDFIHVHHLIEISSRKEEYKIDPIEDLRPVCPNCHAMLHTKEKPTIEELQNIMKNHYYVDSTDSLLQRE